MQQRLTSSGVFLEGSELDVKVADSLNKGFALAQDISLATRQVKGNASGFEEAYIAWIAVKAAW